MEDDEVGAKADADPARAKRAAQAVVFMVAGVGVLRDGQKWRCSGPTPPQIPSLIFSPTTATGVVGYASTVNVKSR